MFYFLSPGVALLILAHAGRTGLGLGLIARHNVASVASAVFLR